MSLVVSESCQTRIPGWSNPRVDWTDAVAFMSTWKHLGGPATRLGVPMTWLGVPGSAGNNSASANDNLGSASNSCGSTSNHSRAVRENNIFFGNQVAGVPGNHSYYSLFNDFSNRCIQFVFSSMYQCHYVATHLHT